ncbi:hypothetical protein QWY82_08155 [Simiduia curdlanivorans]|uniref:Imm11 family protein n=1 Tax=Simiduia curdlanivorans TaxID=1492769 RepID=A0ABV8V6E5_9GAMM|nr:DUF1629 domain-containing protein [Simiduia curdlanivorans]MDN3638777.1 hypothetical protein [Simiduia curdlanivorans]
MTTFRLINNVHGYHEAFVDFRAMRKQFDGVKVWFPQKNETLLDKLKADWRPVSVTFESDSKTNAVPDISVWNSSCLVLSTKAKSVLEPMLANIGEFLLLEDEFFVFNCLESIAGDAVDGSKSTFEIDAEDSMHIPKALTLLADKVAGKVLFKPGFAHNSFLLCDSAFKDVVEKHELGGVVFEGNLAKISL